MPTPRTAVLEIAVTLPGILDKKVNGGQVARHKKSIMTDR